MADMQLCTFMDLLLHGHKHSHEYALLALCNFFISGQLRRNSCLIGRRVKTSSLTKAVIRGSFFFGLKHRKLEAVRCIFLNKILSCVEENLHT